MGLVYLRLRYHEAIAGVVAFADGDGDDADDCVCST